jgi:hypothetical protein
MKDLSLFLFVSALCRYHYAELPNILKQTHTHTQPARAEVCMYVVSLLPVFYFSCTQMSCQLQESVSVTVTHLLLLKQIRVFRNLTSVSSASMKVQYLPLYIKVKGIT